MQECKSGKRLCSDLCSSFIRSLHRRHTAECSGHLELLQAAVDDRRSGRGDQRAHHAGVSHHLPAAAPPGPPVTASPAVRQTAELGRRRGGGSWSGRGCIELRRGFLGLLCFRPAAKDCKPTGGFDWIWIRLLGWRKKGVAAKLLLNDTVSRCDCFSTPPRSAVIG